LKKESGLKRKIGFLILIGLMILSFQNCSVVSNPKIQQSGLASGLSAQGILQSKALNVIRNNCASCHSPAHPENKIYGLVDDIMDTNQLLYYGLVSPSEPGLSPLYEAISGQGAAQGIQAMPPIGSLTTAEINDVYNWINDGFKSNTSVIIPNVDSTLVPTYNSIRAIILGPKCLGCHGTGGTNPNALAAFNMDTYAGVKSKITAGTASSSLLYQRVTQNSAAKPSMPLNRTMLTVDQTNAIRDWINSGGAQ
jgi:mono/diheme cytochrome c family protein